MKGIANLALGQVAKLVLAIIGKIFLYGLAIIFTIGILLIPLVIINFLNDEPDAIWGSTVAVLFMAIRFIASSYS